MVEHFVSAEFDRTIDVEHNKKRIQMIIDYTLLWSSHVIDFSSYSYSLTWIIVIGRQQKKSEMIFVVTRKEGKIIFSNFYLHSWLARLSVSEL